MSILRYAPWLVLFTSFVILAVFYSSLPHEIVITRGFFGSPDTLAPRSPFTVFRVPMIDAICAAAAAILYRKFLLTGSPLSFFWLILLYTAACKSLLQALEIVSPPDLAVVFFYSTLAVVVAGITFAFLVARKRLRGLFTGLGKFNAVESVALALLLIGYLAIAIVPGFIYQ